MRQDFSLFNEASAICVCPYWAMCISVLLPKVTVHLRPSVRSRHVTLVACLVDEPEASAKHKINEFFASV
jgi:hypothetical protein